MTKTTAQPEPRPAQASHPTHHLLHSLAALALLVCLAPARASTPAELLAGYSGQAGQPPQPGRGQQFFTSKQGRDRACANCHGAVPTQAGRHAATAKPIEPLAPAAQPRPGPGGAGRARRRRPCPCPARRAGRLRPRQPAGGAIADPVPVGGRCRQPGHRGHRGHHGHHGHHHSRAVRLADLASLARQVVADLAPAAVARQQTLGLDAPASAPLPADATLLRVLLRNLLDNALRHSPGGAQVRVLVALPGPQHPGALRLQIDDSGCGLAEADRQRLGQRFFRVLGTVSGAGTDGGIGMGDETGSDTGSPARSAGLLSYSRMAEVPTMAARRPA